MGTTDSFKVIPWRKTRLLPPMEKMYISDPVTFFQTMARMFQPGAQVQLCGTLLMRLPDGLEVLEDDIGSVIFGDPKGWWLCLKTKTIINDSTHLFDPEKLEGGPFTFPPGWGRTPPILMADWVGGPESLVISLPIVDRLSIFVRGETTLN